MDASIPNFSTSYIEDGQTEGQPTLGFEVTPFDFPPLNHLPRSVHFSSETCEWATPQDFFDALDAEFGFELDVCATKANAKCGHFYTKEVDGLSQPWEGVCWCNPPYGREIKFWVKKAMITAQAGSATVVCLVPARTDTVWWHDFVSQADEVRFVKGRLKFGGHANSAPFPSAVVVFRARTARIDPSENSPTERPDDSP